jgi:hypothetical protein
LEREKADEEREKKNGKKVDPYVNVRTKPLQQFDGLDQGLRNRRTWG